jgi:predicted MFS family arabinose efflux permease
MSSPIDAVPAVESASADASALAPGVGSVIVLLALVAFGSATSLRVTDAAIPRFASDFSITIRQASYVVTAFSLAYGCLQVVFGPSGDRFGKLRVIFAACVSGSLASLACALCTDFDVLLAARAWAGASMASMVPLAVAWIGDNVAYGSRQPVLARFLLGQMTGIAAGQAIGGIAADLWTWRGPFFALAIYFVVVAVLLYRVMRMPMYRETATAPAGNLFAQCRSVLVRPWARRVLATVFIEGAALYGPFAFFATHLHLKHGLSLSYAGTLLMSFAIGGISFAFGSGKLIRSLGEAGLARWGAVLMFLGVSTVAIAPATWPTISFALPGMFAMGLGFYMLHNTLQMNGTQMAPETRGTALALFSSAFFMGQSGGVALAALVVETVGTTWIIEAGATVLLCVGLWFSFMRSRHAA